MKRDHVPVPAPSSRFLRVECSECNEVQVVYSHASTHVTCNSCGNALATPTGSTAQIHGTPVDPSASA